MSKTVAITGATGFVGSRLVDAFADSGWDVVALSRRPLEQNPRPGVRFERFDLAEPECTALDGVDVVVHSAIEPYRGGGSPAGINVAGSAKLFESARRQGVRKIVFISSTAARAQTSSEYGREKYAVEQLLDPSRDLIVRPGLVLGDGGLLRSMYRTIKKYRIAPLFFAGKKPVYSISVYDLTNAILKLVAENAHGTFTLSCDAIPMKAMYEQLARKAGVRIRLIPLPYAPVLALLELCERAGLKLPLSSGSLRGVATMEPLALPDHVKSGIVIRPFSKVLDEIEFAGL